MKVAGQPGNTVAGQTAMPPFRAAKEIDPELGMPSPQCTRAAGQLGVPGQAVREKASAWVTVAIPWKQPGAVRQPGNR